ncbi:polymorphic toxin-type HINT domain-containing protein [Streptomyces sp. NPDC050504]|uniref:polymorphic toxin-type HINT domain-containing protein n=1 Tax=Streptomyces sp. NPDC050504 TaxID=3365618 RepID=UPI0037919A0C
MTRLRRSKWGRAIGLVLAMLMATVSLAVADVGFPLYPDPLPGAKGPGQRWGSAEGRDHLVDGPRNTELPESLRSKYPLTTPAAARPTPRVNTVAVAAAPAPETTGFDRRTSRELTAERDERSRTYANEDGTRTTELATTSINYRDRKGDWQPIDTSLVERDGSWTNAADAVGVRIARRADSAELAALAFPTGETFGYALDGAAPSAGTADGSRVSYPDVLPETDLWLDSQAGGVKETLVLRSAAAPTDFLFPLRLSGLTARQENGAILLLDAGGRTKAVVPAGYMEDANKTVSQAVRYELVGADGGQALRVSVDAAWLRDPARAFPVRVDPSVDATNASTSMSVRGGGSVVGSSELEIGKGPNGASAAYLGFPGLDEELKHHKVFGAQLQLVNYDSGTCKPRSVSVHPVTEAWTAGTGTSYPGPSVGPAMVSKSFSYGYVGLGQTQSGCPPAAELLDLGKAGRDLVQGWVSGTRANHGLSVRASATDPLAYKKFTGHSTANPPKLYVTHSPYDAAYAFPKPVPDPPVLQNQNGRVKVVVTNRGAETWTPATYYLAYRLYNSKGKLVSQQRAGALPGSVAHGAKATVDATIKALPPGGYLLDFTMVRTGGKVFTDEQVPPGRLTIQVYDIAPVVKEQFPPNGYQAQTLTPQLWAAGVDIDAPAGSKLQYKFEICEADEADKPTACTTSAYQTTSAHPVPAGRLKWGKTYLWRGFVKDASTEVPTARVALLTSVPQPEITSRLAQSGGQEFDPNIGNFTTSAIDSSVTGVGPDMTLVRTYNSLDPRRDLAFGAGWSTRYDMRLTPDDDGTGNVVIRYPDGQDVRFGKNADGTFAPPSGRFAKLTLATPSGTYKLQDKAGTTYDFSNTGLLVKVTDPFNGSVNHTYTGGRLSTAVNSRTGRSLTFTWTGAHVTKVSTNPVDGAPLSWTYGYTGDLLDKVCDPTGGCTLYTYEQGSHYRTTVLDARPESYWRLGEDEGTAAASANESNLGKDRGTYVDVKLGAAGAITGDPGTAAVFNGSTSRVGLPSGTVKKSRDQAVEVWFKTIATGVGGPLIGYQNKAWGTAPGVGVPLLYVGTDGKLRGQFATGTVAPITDGTKNVNDGRWHHAVLSVSGSTQSLYLDGKLSGTITGKQVVQGDLTFNQIGAAHATTPASWPGWGSTGARSFAGTIDDVAVYHHPLGTAAVAGHYREALRASDVLTKTTLPSGNVASEVRYDVSRDRVEEYTDRNGGAWKVGAPAVFGDDKDLRRTVQVQDPLGSPYFYEYDGLTSRMLRYGAPLGIGPRASRPSPSPSPSPTPSPTCSKPDPQDPTFCTTPIGGGGGEPEFIEFPLDGVAIRTFKYDNQGFQTEVHSENGDTVTLGHDDRGNITSRTTCRAPGDCQTAYTTYPVGADDFDLRADQPSESRDGRSTSATDNRYRTRYTYTPSGALATQTAPDGGSVRHSYTDGTQAAVGGGNVPAGLPLTTTDPRGAVTRYQYVKNGDLAAVTDPSGAVTRFTYDELGRKLTQTLVTDAQPAGLTTTYTYDKLSRLTSTTDPAATNVITLGKHQQKAASAYDADGNVVRTEVSDLLGGDEPRVMTFEFDDHGRPEKVRDAEDNETTYAYDAAGNKTSMVDGNGNRFSYLYTARNMLAESRLHDWDDDGGDDDHTVLQSVAYDAGGRVARQTDSMGRSVVYKYFGDDLVKSTTLTDFHDPDGTKRDIVLESNEYDGAGNVLTETAANGKAVTKYTYDAVGRVASTVADPGGTHRGTSYTYDLAGNVLTSRETGNPSNVPWPVTVASKNTSYVYDAVGNLKSQTVENGTAPQTTEYGYDQRGLTTWAKDPEGNVTDYAYDELGRSLSATAPSVQTETSGSAPVAARPSSYTGYDTFGAVTQTQDALGNVSRTAYDQLGRAVSASSPAYKAPGTDTSVTPSIANRYDALGNVLETTDPLGRVTTFAYDRQNRMTAKDVPVGSGDERARWKYSYTRTGQLLSVVSPTGSRSEATYDDLDRMVTSTQIERKPVPAAFTSRSEYDDLGNVLKQTAPGGAYSQVRYNALGQPTRLVDPAGVVTELGYDSLGRQVRQTDGMRRTAAKTYDVLGRLVRDESLDSTNNLLREVRYGYDKVGNLTSSTDALKRTTTYSYDALGRLTTQTEPVSDTKSITTSFGYDAAGNRTRYTDGRGNSTYYTVNTLGLPESVIEPATERDPAPQARTWTVAYDQAGRKVKATAPGGVVTEQEYDKAGLVTRATGSGAETATPEKKFAYDVLGRVTKASTPKGDNSYEYDDRGLLLKATGPSGDATYEYNSDGQLTSRTDAAGTASFGYVSGRLSSSTDPLTRTRQSFGYDAAGLIKQIGYGAGQNRELTYDELGRVDTDTLKSGTGAAVMSTDYDYSIDNHLTAKTSAGTAKPGKETYDYDQAGRLTGWEAEGERTEYAWDDSGNRVKNGAKTATFDERNRVLSDGDYTYDHTERGTLASRTSSGLKEEFTFDAFDRMTKAGESGTEYTYDALDRVFSRNGTDFTYAGASPDPVKDNSATYGRGPGDELLAVAEGSGPARLTIADQHGDVVGSMSATDGAASSLEEKAAFAPFGEKRGTTGVSGNVGYQGDYTDPDTDQVNMGARWYDPGTGAFDSRDTYQYSSGASILANRYTYGNGAPLDFTDPDGNWGCGWCTSALGWGAKKARQGAGYVKDGAVWVGNKVAGGAKATWGYITKGAKYVWGGIQTGLRYASSGISWALKTSWGGLKSLYRNTPGAKQLVDFGRDTARFFTSGEAKRWAKQQAEQAMREAVEIKKTITRNTKAVLAKAAKLNPMPHIAAATKPLMAIGTAIVSATVNAPAALVSATRDVVKDLGAAADRLRDAAVQQIGSVVEDVKDIVDAAVDLAPAAWEGVKTIGNAIGEATGFNDMKRCVTQGDMESCAWALATVAGAATGGAGALLVRSAKAGRMGMKAAKHADDIANVATKVGNAVEKVDTAISRVETAVSCSVAASAAVGNSFVAGTEVVMADGSRKPIEQVEEGDVVLATDPTTGKTSPQEVTDTIVGKGEKHLVELTVDTDGEKGDATEKITATTGHPFWVPSLKKWLTAGELRPGQWLQTGTGTWVQLDAARAWTQQAAVYNLSVDTAHTYYVLAGTTPVLVHNVDLDALNACPATKKTHFASVTVHDSRGKVLHEYDIRSGAQRPSEKAMGLRGGEALSHTENRAARMAGGVPSYGKKISKDDEFFMDTPVPLNGYVVIDGTAPPCPSCMGAMRRAAEDTGSTFTYIWDNSGKAAWWSASG